MRNLITLLVPQRKYLRPGLEIHKRWIWIITGMIFSTSSFAEILSVQIVKEGDIRIAVSPTNLKPYIEKSRRLVKGDDFNLAGRAEELITGATLGAGIGGIAGGITASSIASTLFNPGWVATMAKLCALPIGAGTGAGIGTVVGTLGAFGACSTYLMYQAHKHNQKKELEFFSSAETECVQLGYITVDWSKTSKDIKKLRSKTLT